MAIDYVRYAQGLPRDETDYSSILNNAINSRRVGEAHDQRLQLSNMEIQRQQMEMDRMARKAVLDQRAQAAFQNAQPRTLASLNPAYVSPEKFQEQATTGPPQMNAGQDYNLDYGFAANSSQPIYPAQGVSPQEIASLQNLQPKELMTTQPADPYGDAARVYAKEGDWEGVKGIMSMQDIVAKAKATGDPETYYRAKYASDDYQHFSKIIEPLMKDESTRPQALALSQHYMEKHPKDATMFDISNVQPTPDGFINPLMTPDGRHVGDLVRVNGKNVLKEPAKADPMELLNRRLEAQAAENEKNRIASDRRLERTIAGQAARTTGGSAGSGKPMPPAALRMQQDAVDAIGLASNLRADLGAIKQQVSSGELQLGPISNVVGTGLNMAGMSTQNSRNLATFKSTLEKLRNDSLRLNKGVQTEGDAVRAWKELLANINDPQLVQQRLTEIENINSRAADLQEMNIENIRDNYGKAPLDTTRAKTQPAAIGKAKPAGPKPGTVEGGYRFKGGDPSKPSSWVKVGK